jgi:hypothetical protein
VTQTTRVTQGLRSVRLRHQEVFVRAEMKPLAASAVTSRTASRGAPADRLAGSRAGTRTTSPASDVVIAAG